MQRRPGQQGSIELRGNIYYARFWKDEPGKATRTYKRVRICPVEGPGSLGKTQRKRRLQQIVQEHGANDEPTFRAAEAANLSTPFKEQAALWFESVQHRKRRPIKPRTAASWKGYLKYINATIGDTPLADVNNNSVKLFIAKMADAKTKDGEPRFSVKSIANYLQIVKMVVAHAKNEKGEQVYPVRWDAEYMDVPLIADQHTPCFTAAEIETIVSKAEGQEQLLFAFLAGTGLRIGEAFALTVPDLQGTVVNVRHSMWEGVQTSPKTASGTRAVDLHSSLADALSAHLAGRTAGYIFQSERGTALRKSNLLRRSLHPILKKMGKPLCGFHAFRRFRAAHLDKELVPEILVHIWMGHSNKDISQRYSRSGVKIDSLYRTITAQRVGLGFNFSTKVTTSYTHVEPQVTSVSV
ncbi:MAG TPA: tyrosine-type recombinase/integrase [Terriglobales bacterium]|nr:tyrosine-type recombinase/integrase [Terriglobales bacterium]